MKYCSNCGKEISENDLFCPNCGANLSNQPKEQISNENVVESDVEVVSAEDNTYIPSDKSEPTNSKTDAFAITGFILSLVSFLCCGSLSWLGLIFSIIGFIQTKKNKTNGKGLAIAGIVISSILLILAIILVCLYFLGIGIFRASNYPYY